MISLKNKNQNPKPLILGSIAFDYIMEYPDLFQKNVVISDDSFYGSFVVKTLRVQRGGTAGNIAFNLGTLEHDSIVISAVGNDFYTHGYDSILSKKKVDLRLDINDQELTAACNVISDKKQNQIITFYPGALKNSVKIDLTQKLSDDDFIPIAINAPNPDLLAIHKHCKQLKEMNIPQIFDPGQNINAFSEKQMQEILDLSEYLMLNDSELTMLHNKFQISKSDLIDRMDWMIITHGSKGSICYQGKNKYKITACPPQKVSETTGAGDAYRAGLLYALAAEKPLEHACKVGSTVASFSVESPVPQNEEYSLNDMKQRFNEHFGD